MMREARVPGRSRGIRAAVTAMLALGGVALSSTLSRADRISFRGGGQVRGKVLPDPKRPGGVIVLTERGKTPLIFRKEQIAGVVAEPSALDEYLTRRDAAPATAEGQYDLGAWCEGHKLPDLAAVHFEAALAHDAGFSPAHQKLGHVRYGERWLHGDELREAQGLVRDRGKWVTREEKARRDEDRASASEAASWARQIRVLRDALVYGAEDRRREAESQLLDIRDPAAVGPLVKVLGGDLDPVRTLLARVLGPVPGPEAARALVGVLLAEGDPDVRRSILAEVVGRKDADVMRALEKALRSAAPPVVNRAAWALGQLDDPSAVPALVPALVTTREEMVLGPPVGGGGGGPAITAAFGSVPPTSGYGSTPIAYNGSSIAYLNGPVVGPGVAAYGATAVPAYPVPNPLASLPGGVAASFGATTGVPGGGGLSASRGPVPRLITLSFQNLEVRAALVRLTGVDFGFNVPAWKRWLKTSFRSEPAPVRRAPQP